tara:strand:- start:1733 stop:2875 length:1143 start_codon:yes stop_codon:yes gene_type:complete
MAGLKNNLQLKTDLINKINHLTFLNKEQWKYTNFNYLTNFNFKSNDISKNQFTIKKSNSIDVFPINSLTKEKDKKFLKIFNQIIPQENKFILYNTAYFHNGHYFDIKKNSNDAYIFIDNKTTTNSKDNFTNDRMIFNFNKKSRSTIFLNEKNIKKAKNNSVFELYLDNDSSVDFIVHSNQPNATKILNLSANINKNATLNFYTINISGELIKNNYYFSLNNKNSACNFNGIGLLNKKNHIDNYIEINHNEKHTSSNLNFNNILNDYSKGIFYAKTVINKQCSQSEASQNNKNMLLSKSSSMQSNPQLIINNDDVQCSHGSTTGEIDSDALFYMQSRGIKIDQAKKMLINSFLSNLISEIKNKEILKMINNQINAWIKNVD